MTTPDSVARIAEQRDAPAFVELLREADADLADAAFEPSVADVPRVEPGLIDRDYGQWAGHHRYRSVPQKRDRAALIHQEERNEKTRFSENQRRRSPNPIPTNTITQTIPAFLYTSAQGVAFYTLDPTPYTLTHPFIRSFTLCASFSISSAFLITSLNQPISDGFLHFPAASDTACSGWIVMRSAAPTGTEHTSYTNRSVRTMSLALSSNRNQSSSTDRSNKFIAIFAY